MEKRAPVMTIEDIERALPHRYPFLLIDRVVEIVDGPDTAKRQGRKVTCIKNVTANEPFFTGHFPNWKVMPGVLQVEAMAQASALACILPGDKDFSVVIASIENARFRKPVVPGDTLVIVAEVLKERGMLISARAESFVEGTKVSEVQIMARVFLKSENI